MTSLSFSDLSDADVIARVKCAAERERLATAELIGLLAECDARRLYLGEGCSSLFTYCTQLLRLSEAQAYGRITAARAARRFPATLALLSAGEITLTTVGLLSAHLDEGNCDGLLEAARRKSRREVESLVASLVPQPEIPASIRRLPSTARSGEPAAVAALPMTEAPGVTKATRSETSSPMPVASVDSCSRGTRPAVAPLAADRYLLRVTVTEETHRKLERATSLLRHVIPNGDVAVVLDRALTLLVNDLERTRLATTRRSARAPTPSDLKSAHSRRVPASVRREVWARDGGRCAFVGTEGRCQSTSCLEFHHAIPYAHGGATSMENLQLRCRSHNQFEAILAFGGPRRLHLAASPRDSTVLRNHE